jgi:hypothetical protein
MMLVWGGSTSSVCCIMMSYYGLGKIWLDGVGTLLDGLVEDTPVELFCRFTSFVF